MRRLEHTICVGTRIPTNEGREAEAADFQVCQSILVQFYVCDPFTFVFFDFACQ